MRLSLVVVLLVVGCGSGRASAPTSPAAEARAVQPTAEDANAAMLGLSASVDPVRGVLVLARVEDPSDGEGPAPIASGLRCGAAIDELAARLSDYVSDRRAMGASVEWTCRAARCELPGIMEFDPARVIHFDHDAAGGLVVTGIDFFDEPPDGVRLRAELDAAQARARDVCR